MADDDRDVWRMGHRRPWWMWNVVTLLVALFVLVWTRELAKLSQTTTWLTCVGILLVWWITPLVLLERSTRPADGPRPGEARGDASAAATMFLRTLVYAASLMLFVAVFWLGGFAVCALALIGALLYAAAGRLRID